MKPISAACCAICRNESRRQRIGVYPIPGPRNCSTTDDLGTPRDSAARSPSLKCKHLISKPMKMVRLNFSDALGTLKRWRSYVQAESTR
jgi:hypothetical protein